MKTGPGRKEGRKHGRKVQEGQKVKTTTWTDGYLTGV
jgi:hypothetical protein